MLHAQFAAEQFIVSDVKGSNEGLHDEPAQEDTSVTYTANLLEAKQVSQHLCVTRPNRDIGCSSQRWNRCDIAA